MNPAASPFKFLDSYTREDREIFFGRDREIEELYQKVFDSKVLLVCGVSGTGKTSLINCGLANKFEESDWLPISIRRGNDITASLKDGISRVAITPVNKKQSIVNQLQSLYLDHFKPTYLIFDQFEEVFIFGNREERHELIKEVKKIIDSDVQCRLMFVMREEYLAGAIEFEKEIPTFLTNRLRIEKMTWQHAIEVIEGPCRVRGLEVEKKFPEALLEKLNPEGKEVELTYLQVFLDKIYKSAIDAQPKRGNQKLKPAGKPGTGTREYGLVFSIDLLDRVGDISDLLGSFLEEQINALEDPETGLMVLKAFVSVKGTKRQITEDEVDEFCKTLGKLIESNHLKQLIQRFVNLRILRDKDENDRYELRHDSLASKIFEKITLVEKELLEVRQFIENAYQTYEKRSILLSDKDMKYLKVYEDRLFLSGNLKEFVEQSKKAIHLKRRQFNTILRISLAGFILFFIGIGYYYYQSTSETKNIERAAVALLQSDQVPGLSFLTALDAYRMDTASSLAHFALLNSFYKMLEDGEYYDSVDESYYDPYKRIFDFRPCHSQILSARFSNDGQFIYGWLEDNTVKVWDIHGKEVFNIAGREIQIVTVSISNNDEFIAIVNQDSTGSLWRIRGDKIFEFPVAINPVYNNKVIDFSHDNRFLAVAGLNNNINLYDFQGNNLQVLSGHKGQVNYLSFSPDKRFIASAADDKRVIIWNYNTHKNLFGLYDSITSHSRSVRSCNFSKNSKYILSAADDSTIAISDLNGDLVFMERLLRSSTIPCNAEFSENEKFILITRYRSVHADSIIYTQRIKNERWWNYVDNILFTRSKLIRHNSFAVYRKPRVLVYNAYNNTLSIIPPDKNHIILISHDLLPLRHFKGDLPSYSPDGDYLLYINGSELTLFPVSAPEIIRLVMEEMIFGEMISEGKDWIYYL